MGLFKKIFSREKKETLDKGLEKTKQGVFEKIKHAVAGKSTVDDDVLDNLEEVFVTSDVGVDTTVKIIDRLQARVARDKYVGTEELNELLCDEISQMLADNNNAELEDFTVPEDSKPYVIMVVGVNGVGKTTTIGKLAYQFKQAGNKVVLGAADTYRAAADEQLEIWGNRVGVPVIKHKMGTDPAAVAYDAVQSAKAQNADVVIPCARCCPMLRKRCCSCSTALRARTPLSRPSSSRQLPRSTPWLSPSSTALPREAWSSA